MLDKELYLPLEKKSLVQQNNTSGIILQDVIGYNSNQFKLEFKQKAKSNNLPDWFLQQQLDTVNSNNTEFALYSLQKRVWNFELFTILKNNNDEFEIYLNYELNAKDIGEPTRNYHKLCNLKMNEAVKVSINGKSDSNMGSGKDRSYAEYEYIIEYLGEVENIEFREFNKIESTKELPKLIVNHIDLRKILY